VNLRSPTCACGEATVKMFGPEGSKAVYWCRRCGAVRLAFESTWLIPLDRSGDVSATALRELRDRGEESFDEEEPTLPETPGAKEKPPKR
jgi:hypothetical protein